MRFEMFRSTETLARLAVDLWAKSFKPKNNQKIKNSIEIIKAKEKKKNRLKICERLLNRMWRQVSFNDVILPEFNPEPPDADERMRCALADLFSEDNPSHGGQAHGVS